MKIGILTFSSAFNFGAVLQCYALYCTLYNMGHQIKIIDYRPVYLATYKPIWGLRNWINRDILTLYSRRSKYKFWRKIYDGYDKFEHNYMEMTVPCYTTNEVEKIASMFDYVVVGSDQVWNAKYNNCDPVWYGNVNTHSTKWISYAASIGPISTSTSLQQQLEEIVRNFDFISVREADLCKILQERTSKQIELVVDPSLLPEANFWREWSAPILSSNYLITYQARQSDAVFKIARHVSKQLGDITIIPIDFWDNVKANGYETFIATPVQFISLIKNAACVITTSFHGTAFSITLGTPFYAVRLNDGADGRIEHLLNSLGLLNRFINASTLPTFQTIDFAKPWQSLKIMRQSSISYLNNSIQ